MISLVFTKLLSHSQQPVYRLWEQGLFTLDPESTVHNLRTFELWVPRPSVVP